MPSFLSPAEICAYTEEAGVKKAFLSPGRQFLLAFLAGAFIAFAAEGSTMAAFNLLADPGSYGLGRCLAGVVFPTGLMLVILAGGELFTGNTLMGIALARRRISLASMLGNWAVVYIGNFTGSVFLAHMMAASGLFNNGAGLLGGVTIKDSLRKSLPAVCVGLLSGPHVQLAGLPGRMDCLRRKRHGRKNPRDFLPHMAFHHFRF